MRTNVVEKGKWERQVAVEVPAERIEAELVRAYQKYQKRLEVPGFRKGKVPIRIIKARYGATIRGEVLNDLFPKLLEEAARDAGLAPAAPPTISDLKHEPGQDLTFTMSFDIWPELGNVEYEGLRVSRLVHEVTEEEVDEQLREVRNQQATERSVERPLQKGDVLLADLQRVDASGLTIIGERFEDRRFVIGEGDGPSPEFDEALVGISAGEERTVRFSYRKDLTNRELAGTRDQFRVTARQIHERILPELDDELAKDLGEQFQTLADLRQHIRSQLEQQWEYVGRRRLHGQLLERLVHRNPFEVPASLVRRYLESLHQAGEEEHAPEHAREEGQEHGEEEQRAAERRLRGHLLLDALRKQAGITVSDEEFSRFLGERAEATGVKPEGLRRSGRVDDLRRELEERKVLRLLEQRAEVTEEKV